MPSLVRNVTVKAADLFRYWMGPYMYDNQVDVTKTENQIRIESVYYPIIDDGTDRFHGRARLQAQIQHLLPRH